MVPLSEQGLINVRPSLAPDFVYECLMNKIILFCYTFIIVSFYLFCWQVTP